MFLFFLVWNPELIFSIGILEMKKNFLNWVLWADDRGFTLASLGAVSVGRTQ